MTKNTVIGIDLAKRTFHCVGLNEDGKKSLSAKLKREDLLPYLEQHACKESLVAMEACASSHFWCQELTKAGFQSIKLLKPCDVKPYAKAKQKNDTNDALAIAKAAKDPELKPVVPKTKEEQTVHLIHNLRQNTIHERTRKSNSLMAELLEFGYDAKCGKSQFAKCVSDKVKEAFEQGYINQEVRHLLDREAEDINLLLSKEKEFDRRIWELNRHSPKAKLLQTIPGIGAINASILSIAPMHAYETGRDFAASLGLVPSQHSTGGVTKLGRITKKGSRYTRTILIQGARSIVIGAKGPKESDDKLIVWARNLLKTKPFNQVAVAVANKLARFAHACITHGKAYQGSTMTVSL